MRKSVITLIFIIFVFSSCIQKKEENKKMNLLFIWTDQQRFDTMKAYGNNNIKTPNLNKLAEESIVFKRAYVTQPVCTPSRSSVMTGLYPHTNGCIENNIPLKPETKTLPELINDPDYNDTKTDLLAEIEIWKIKTDDVFPAWPWHAKESY